MKRKNALSMSLLIGVAATSILALSWKVEAEVTPILANNQPIVKTVYTSYIAEQPIAGISIQLSKVKNYKISETKSAETKPTFEFTKKEKEILYRIVEAETTGKDEDSKKNVASVVIQRTLSDSFPDTIEKVVFQKTNGVFQYSPIGDKRYYKVDITEETKKAVDYVIKNGTTSDALYFFNLEDVQSSKIKKWIRNKLEFVLEDESHSFYKEK